MPNDILEVKDNELGDDEVLTEDGLKTLAGEETETPTSSSEGDKPTDDSTAESTKPDGDEVETPVEEPVVETDGEVPVTTETAKDVEGESPREKALRLEVQRVKEINRILRGKKLLGDVPPQVASQPAELSPEDKQALEVFDPEQVANMEKLLPVLAKKLGFVKKVELSQDQYANTSQDVLDKWLEVHPDYQPENDKGDILFNRLKEELSLYQKPNNPKDWVKLLNRAHNEVMGITTKPKVTTEQVAAQQEKIKTASHGAVATKPNISTAPRASKSDAELRSLAERGALKGFTAEDLDEIFGS